MAHFHAVTPDEAAHTAPGDNGVCRCADHSAPSVQKDGPIPACTYECYICERTRILEARVAERDNPLPLAGEEKAIKAAKQAASLARGGCGCGSYSPRALKALAKAVR